MEAEPIIRRVGHSNFAVQAYKADTSVVLSVTSAPSRLSRSLQNRTSEESHYSGTGPGLHFHLPRHPRGSDAISPVRGGGVSICPHLHQ